VKNVTMPFRWSAVLLLLLVIAGCDRGEEATGFAQAVDLEPFGALAVHTEGRIKSFDSFASTRMKFVTGPKGVNGQSPSFTYLDMMLRHDRYHASPSVYVKNKSVRLSVLDAIPYDSGIDDAARDEAFETGLFTPTWFEIPAVQEKLGELESDLMRSAKPVERLRGALNVSEPFSLLMSLRIVPPPGGGRDDRWLSPHELAMMEADMLPADAVAPETRDGISTAWSDLVTAWHAEDAAAVTAASTQLVSLLPQVNAEDGLYPATRKLELESWYFRSYNMTWVWIVYLLALVPLLMFVAFRWEGARWFGLFLFLIAFGLHTSAVMLRWYVSGRWPNSNMFEAVTTAVWFGGCFALIFELLAWRSPVRGLAAIGSATASMVAMMCAKFWPLHLDASIGNMMPVLHDLWLYIHTNVIIFSYCLIFMATITAGLYLIGRVIKGLGGKSGRDDYARVGGAGSLIMQSPDGGTYLARAKTNVLQVFDGMTMILLEMSFVLLWAGIVMGAIWADHSWGRPWGWDPKEVFALNTFIVFAVLIHTRMKVKDKGLATAIIAVIGCAVMLFNWVCVNFAIVGLHSYA
jgi:cytochrome c-type biogenesis protein CcsB